MRIQDDYELLDSGNGHKLERFGSVILSRPCAQAVWQPRLPELWDSANASFDRKEGLNWHGRDRLPEEWVVTVRGVRMRLSTTDFGHLGIFPETLDMWEWIAGRVQEAAQGGTAPRFLNLFAYSGGATLAAAAAGAACWPPRRVQGHGRMGQGQRGPERPGRPEHALHCGRCKRLSPARGTPRPQIRLRAP